MSSLDTSQLLRILSPYYRHLGHATRAPRLFLVQEITVLDINLSNQFDLRNISPHLHECLYHKMI